MSNLVSSRTRTVHAAASVESNVPLCSARIATLNGNTGHLSVTCGNCKRTIARVHAEALELHKDFLLMPGDLCEWFAGCFEPATAHRNHPIIGQVPVCPTHLTFGVDMTKGTPHSKDDDNAREKHTKRPVGQGTKITGDAAKGKDKLNKLLKEWKDDIDEG